MTRKLQELFDLPSDDAEPAQLDIPTTQTALLEIDSAIDKIEAALPMVKGLEASDQEMDNLATKAEKSFDDLMDLGMNVDSRFAAEIFAVAGAMLGHALTAKTAKLNKKLKMIDLQLKKARLDQTKEPEDAPTQTAHGQVLSRNDLLERIMNSRDQKSK